MMLRGFIARQRSKEVRPGSFVFSILVLWKLFILVNQRRDFSLFRFFRSNRLPVSDLAFDPESFLNIEILFVAAGKDLRMLQFSIPAAIQSVKRISRRLGTTVIVPQNDLQECKDLLVKWGMKEVTLASENSFLEEQTMKKLRERFGKRYGWCLQQLLKVNFVLNSKRDAVLVVDADTVLLDERIWINSNREQILLASDEYHKSYYDFLSSIGISKKRPDFTFITHHMLMQPKFLRQALLHAGCSSSEDLVEKLLRYNFLDSQSPFSIDYELYGQYVFTHHRDKVSLSKWCNRSFPAEDNLQDVIYRAISESKNKFSSLSFHSYLR